MNKIVRIFVAISILLIIILLPIFVLVWQGDVVVQKVAALQNSESSKADAQIYAEHTLGFLLNTDNLPAQMTESEAAHMQDVKNLFVVGEWMLVISIMILVGSYFILKNPQTYWCSLRAGSVLTIIIIILLGIFMLFDFENIFIHFHQIFFPQGNWIFPSNSLMIQIFPESLFEWLGMMSTSASLFLAGIIAIFSQYKIKKGT
ncbi:MAG: DUF1461 domain-containing protein [Candidatus Moranbacteria bacterium]|nr:DUF1461 domain-containing protein [Candidatus Moranbacteria bacterium]